MGELTKDPKGAKTRERRTPSDTIRSQEVDLERTDRLPIVEGTIFDDDVEDDAVRMEFAPAMPSVKGESGRTPVPDFPRPSSVDLPSLADSVRSVEERIIRQQTEYEGLNRSFEKARDAEAAATARAKSLEADLASLRTLLEGEQTRARETEKSLAAKEAAAEAMRTRMEEHARESERHHSEARTLKNTLTARDAAIAEVLHSLGERDAQLNALQREHARVVPALEERAKAVTQLESDLLAARARSEAVADENRKGRQAAAALTTRLKGGDIDLANAQRDIASVKAHAASYLEQLQSREWRRGFDENLFRDLDARIGAARGDQGALEAERDELRRRAVDLEAKLGLRDEAIRKLNAARTDDEGMRAKRELDLQSVESARAALADQMSTLQAERDRLAGELTARDALIDELRSAVTAEQSATAAHEVKLQKAERTCADLAAQVAAVEIERDRLNDELSKRDGAVADALLARRSEEERGKALAASAEKLQSEMTSQLEQMRSQSRARDEEVEVLMAHLAQARRPVEIFEAEIKRLTDDLAVMTTTNEQLAEDNRVVRASLERTRGALQEREFLIRRLERSESNNANVLGRIQTSIERLGAPNGAVLGAAGAVECMAELVRVDGQANTSYPLGRRTRIGRAPGCEMQIDASSVSRHHALVLMSPRDVIIEDLNSTNGVLVNGRKVSRQLLHDGDLVTIGDAQFRLNAKLIPRVLEAGPAPEVTPEDTAVPPLPPAATPEVE